MSTCEWCGADPAYCLLHHPESKCIRELKTELEGWYQGYVMQEARAEALEADLAAYKKAALENTDREARIHKAEARAAALQKQLEAAKALLGEFCDDVDKSVKAYLLSHPPEAKKGDGA